MRQADEVWISSSIRELVPVVQVDEAIIGDGTVGRYAHDIRKAYRTACDSRNDAQAMVKKAQPTLTVP